MPRVQADSRIFAVFALLNAVGYDREYLPAYRGVRRQVRRLLVPERERWRELLHRDVLLEALKASGATMIDLALTLSGPPSFEPSKGGPRLSTSWQRESLSSLAGMPPLLREFWVKARLNELWVAIQPGYDARIRDFVKYRPFLENVAEHLGGTGIEVNVLPNLLDVDGRGYSVSTDEETNLIIGGETIHTNYAALLLHEFLHRWADVIADTVIRDWSGEDPAPYLRAVYPEVAQNYPDLAIWLAETLVRGASLVLARKLELPPSRPIQDRQAAEAAGFPIGAVCEVLDLSHPTAWEESLGEASIKILAAAEQRIQSGAEKEESHGNV